MAALRLRSVNWNAALGAVPRLSVTARSVAAQTLSLAALYTRDFDTALSRLRKAARLEPFNPLHELRRALLFARFGDSERALASIEKIKKWLPDNPLTDYLRALFALRAGRAEQARAITGTLETAHPNFIPGRFLRAEAQLIIAARPGATEKYLAALPSGPKWDSLWADLLIKIIFLHPQEGPAMAAKHLNKKVSANSPARALVERALSRAGSTAEQLSQLLNNEIPDSQGEALLLECLIDRLNKGASEEAVRTLAGMRKAHPQRAALRCMFDAFLSHRAAELSTGGRYEEALRLAERCLREQPQDLIYHQNRAALFTLLREPAAYHEAWTALNRHQYRLVLFGSMDVFTLSQVAKTHRLFAQQARGGAERGVFRHVEGKDGEKDRTVTNGDEIAADPDLLRQWMHHTAAELVFRHAVLGSDGNRLLLNVQDRDQALERIQGLTRLAGSLETLVPDEGAAVARFLSGRWRTAAATIHTRYEGLKRRSPAEMLGVTTEKAESGEAGTGGAGDVEVQRLKYEHVETFADLALVCLQWRPEFAHLWVAEELIEIVQAAAAFFDEGWLYALEARPGLESPYPVQVLGSHIRSVAGVEDRVRLTPAQRKAVVNSLVGELLREMGMSVYSGHSGSAKESALRAMPYVDRARALRPADPEVELTAARILTLGEFFEEARVALERFRRVTKPEAQRSIEEADKIAEVLRDRRKEGKSGEKRDRNAQGGMPMDNRDFRIEELEGELDRTPGAWRLYEEMVRELGLAGRFDDAVLWADRSVSHCLSRAEQMNARGLAIGARGMKALGQANPNAARLYAAGAHEPARKAIEATGALDYTLLYLLGRCQLAGGMPDAALESFRSAAACCERQMHRTVLRHLTENIDNAYLAIAHSTINTALQEGSAADALEQAVPVFSRLREPASWLVDFARIFFTSALNRIGSSMPPLPTPRITLAIPWQGRLAEALAKSEDADRALALCELAIQLHPASARKAQALVERTQTLKRQIAAVNALNHVGRLLGDRRFAEATAFFDKLDPALAAEPRLLRVRALALLGLRRFDDADMVVEQIGEGGIDEIREFVAQYPSISFRQRIAAAQQLLRDVKPAEAEAILRGATPANPKETADLAYCKAFSATLDAYELRRKGREADARERFRTALILIEPQLDYSLGEAGRHITDLYDRLEKETESHAGR